MKVLLLMNSPGRQIEIRPALLAVVAALLLCSSVRAEELEAVTYTPAVKVVAPLSGEGLLWAPVLSPTPRNQIAFQFAYGYHGFDIAGEDIDASVYLMVLSGEYTVPGKLALRFGLNEAEFYYGDFSLGIQLGYLMGD